MVLLKMALAGAVQQQSKPLLTLSTYKVVRSVTFCLPCTARPANERRLRSHERGRRRGHGCSSCGAADVAVIFDTADTPGE